MPDSRDFPIGRIFSPSRVWIACALGATLLLATGGAFAQGTPDLKTQRDKVMYSIGVNLASNLRAQGLDVDLDLVTRGMRDALSGGPMLLSDEEIRIAIQRYQLDLRRKQGRAAASAGEANRVAGEAFLAKNRSSEGVVTLPSGLQYRVLTAGAGTRPTDADTVEVSLRGTLLNGVGIEGLGNGGRRTMKIREAIPGLAEALRLMPVGSRWKVFIPGPLGYAERGKPGAVGPNAILIYDVELLAIK